MKAINHTEVPSSYEEDLNKIYSKWKNGKLVSLDEGRYVTLFVGHQSEDYYDNDEKITHTVAFPIRVEKPVNREKAINAAEMTAYGLSTAMDVASFTAALARKSREDAEDEEVVEHDDFISWIKSELTKIGIL